MIRTTFRAYKEHYQNDLENFLLDYEDNTKSFFLEKELEKYLDYQSALTIIPKKLNYPTAEELKTISINSSIAMKLRKTCLEAYKDIVSTSIIKVEFEEVDGDFLLPNAVPSLINIDFNKLNNYTKSVKLILEFISNEINPPSFASQIYGNYETPFRNSTFSKNAKAENFIYSNESIVATKKTISTFKWKLNSGHILSTILLQKLKEEEFIDSNTELQHFQKAFDGSAIMNHLKIRWTAKGKNGLINKHLLFYLFNKLADNNLIDENSANATFVKTLGMIFCNHEGSTISNLNVSNNTSSKKNQSKGARKTPDEIRIDAIIQQLRQMPETLKS